MKKYLLAIFLIVAILFSGCSKKDYVFYSEESNLIGLKSINVEEEYIEFEIDDRQVDEDYNVAKWFINSPEKYCKTAWYYDLGNKKYETTKDVEIDTTKHGYLLRVFCDKPEDVGYIRFDSVSIDFNGMSAPSIEVELAGGEVINYYRQSFDGEGSWSEVESEDVFFPLQEE